MTYHHCESCCKADIPDGYLVLDAALDAIKVPEHPTVGMKRPRVHDDDSSDDVSEKRPTVAQEDDSGDASDAEST
jgi:hypothetical protein